MLEFPTKDYVRVPERRWPRAIASQKPAFVTVYSGGVDITIKPYFDGGYGYFIPKSSGKLPGPAARYSDLGEGVYWYQPY